jgi:hypothetical protein
MGINRGFMVVESDPYSHTRHMVKYEQKKKEIKGSALDKMIILENHSCAHFLPNLIKEDYYYAKWTYFFLVLFIISFFDCHITFVL